MWFRLPGSRVRQYGQPCGPGDIPPRRQGRRLPECVGVPIPEGTSPRHLAAMLLQDRVKGEDVSIRITNREGAMAPWWGRQLLHPCERQAFRSRVFSLNILTRQTPSAQGEWPRLAWVDPEGYTLGVAPQGQGTGLQGKFDRVGRRNLGFDLQYLLIGGPHLLKIGGPDRYTCELHPLPPASHEGYVRIAVWGRQRPSQMRIIRFRRSEGGCHVLCAPINTRHGVGYHAGRG